MATVVKELDTAAAPDEVWEAIRDVGALHTRLVPGFVVDTVLDGDVRVVTFASGLVAREPIVTVDPDRRRLVWTLDGGAPTHYSSSVQAVARATGGTHVVWITDVLPDAIAPRIEAAMTMGIAAMRPALDALVAAG